MVLKKNSIITRKFIAGIAFVALILLPSCGGGTYGTGVTQSFKTGEELEKEPKKESTNPEWIKNLLGLSCRYRDLRLGFETEFGAVNGDSSPLCIAEIPPQAQTIRVLLRPSEKLPAAVPLYISRFKCFDDLIPIDNSEGKISIVRNTATLPELEWQDDQYFTVSLSLESQMVSFVLKREGNCK